MLFTDLFSLCGHVSHCGSVSVRTSLWLRKLTSSHEEIKICLVKLTLQIKARSLTSCAQCCWPLLCRTGVSEGTTASIQDSGPPLEGREEDRKKTKLHSCWSPCVPDTCDTKHERVYCVVFSFNLSSAALFLLDRTLKVSFLLFSLLCRLHRVKLTNSD